MKLEIALLIAVGAAVVGQVLGALLTLFGGWVNDYFASKRQERQQQHEEGLRRAQEQRQDQLNLRDARARVYKVFLSSASIESPLLAEERPGYHRALNDAYIETMFYAGVLVRKYADSVYSAAGEAIDSSVESAPVWGRL